MYVRRQLMLTVMAGAISLAASPVLAQDAAEPADGLPEVEVIQQKAAPKQAGPAPQYTPTPQPPPAAAAPVEYVDDTPVLENSPYGAAASGPAASRAEAGPLSPINARTTLPGDLQNYPGAGTRVSSDQLEANRPLHNHDALTRVPGVVTINDDGMARHSGIGIRGSAPRRSRKVLVMEDGQPINFATYLDSSTHYTPPIERIESIEVMRGMVLNYGPLNNHGVVNFRNLSPFGANETVIKAGLGWTEGSDRDINNMRHVHTRQNIGNVGVVASYSGADMGGSWDVEDLGYNDFYGAIGFRGTNQDLTISGGFFRQRDTYDEDNFDDGDVAGFFANGRNKARGAALGAFEGMCCHDLSSYNGDHYRFQVAHNLYINSNTTLSTRVYHADHDRARFYPGELEVEDLAGDDAGVDYDRDTIYMEGRDRRYRNTGIDSRIEFANLPLFGGMTHDVQAGVRYEEQRFRNRNRANFIQDAPLAPPADASGLPAGPGNNLGRILTHGNRGMIASQANLDADAFAAFIQTAIHVTPTLTVVPGVRFESYDVTLLDGGDSFSSSHDEVLPGISFAWEAMPRTTVYGGYYRGLTPHTVRDANDADESGFPLDDEIGDNFQIGLRSTGVRGLTFDAAYFHQRIENYQFKEAFTVPPFNLQVYSSLDEVEINGFELLARLDSQPFTGGPWNFFGEAIYTYADAEITTGLNEDGDSVAGNQAPESVKHSANLTFGVEYRKLWDASISATHLGSYFTNEDNDQEVPSQWLLSARGNFHVTDDLTLWATGYNLTDEFYIAQIADGLKPGLGRTVMGGFTYKFD